MDTPPPPPPPATPPPPPAVPPPVAAQYPILFWPRVLAVLVDSLVMAAVYVVLIGGGFALGVGLAEAGSPDAAVGVALMGMFALVLLAPLVSLGYQTVLTARGATWGKRALRLRVQRADGTDPGLALALGRTLLLAVLGPVSLIGLLHGDRRAYHDLLCDLHVVQLSRRS